MDEQQRRIAAMALDMADFEDYTTEEDMLEMMRRRENPNNINGVPGYRFPLDQEEVEAEMSNEMFDYQPAQVACYSKMGSDHTIGGVHSGHSPHCFLSDERVDGSEMEEDSTNQTISEVTRQIAACRQGCLINGGQAYIPQFLSLLMTSTMGKKGILQAFPSDLCKLLMVSDLSVKDCEKLSSRVIASYNRLEYVLSTCSSSLDQYKVCCVFYLSKKIVGKLFEFFECFKKLNIDDIFDHSKNSTFRNISNVRKYHLY